MYISDYPKSLEHLLKAVTYFKKHNQTYNLASTYTNLGALYASMGEYTKAFDYYKQASDLYTQTSDQQGLLRIEVNTSLLEIQLGQTAKAKSTLIKALEHYQKLNDTANTSKILYVLSHVALQEQNLDKALSYLDKATALARAKNDSILQSISMTNYGTIYEYQGQTDKAIQAYREGMALSDNKSINLERLKRLSNLLSDKGQHQQANTLLNQYYSLKDSIAGGLAKQQVKNLEWSSVLDQVQDQHTLENLKQTKLRTIYALVGIGILVVAIVIWLLYRNNKKSLYISRLENIRLEDSVKSKMQLQKIMEQQHQVELKSKTEFYQLQEKLREIQTKSHEFESQSHKQIQDLQDRQHELEIESKNRELTTINLQLIAKSKLLNHIEQLIEKVPEKKTLLYKDIRASIKESRNHNKDWHQFKTLFEKIHPNFFEALHKRYPELTKTEIRICGYIKINMDNASIAHILNISHQSLITNRYKIRKKMNLTQRSDDLDQCIKNI